MRHMIYYCTFCCTFRRQHAVRETPLEWNPPLVSITTREIYLQAVFLATAVGKMAFCHLDTVRFSVRWRRWGRYIVCIWIVSRYTCNISYKGTWRLPPARSLSLTPNHQMWLARKEKAPVTDERASKLIACTAAFYPNHQSDWCWDATDPLQTYRLDFICTPAKR